ncbi:NAD(P)/FAD-dependent oxidoreductase [Streptomyces sp. H27-D2]|uniref:NAD(P)/FAD-dependent oxidoreductase n=1 Tax=Streptomyces sp. H27-D2 TaxID=3046304 RepID=UPI002DBA98C3|nr:FAD-dependent oxidoreductase [Streptomyces sp. H27-D2]MEC4017548.1 FAD-dependent oxidoreductase [Streptomyces sp. H27-D2]
MIGAGQGGYQTASSLRESGFTGRVLLVGDEPGLPYERPPLSKAYLSGTLDAEKLQLRPGSYYERNTIELVNQRVSRIDRQARTVRLADGGTLRYDHLVLATGARNRVLPIPGNDLAGVVPLRTRQDTDLLRSSLVTAKNVVVVGAGFIGLEFAAMANKLGHLVTVVEALDRPMARVVTPSTAGYFTALHEQHGNRFAFGRGVAAFHGDGAGRVTGVELADGTRLAADLVLVGVGVAPDTELARLAGLDVDNGVVVDAHLTTSDPAISAIGDCASFPSVQTGARVRLESVQNAVDHARCVATRITGERRPYGDLPWFWSDQFASTLQIAGVGDGHDTAVPLGDAGGAFSALLFRDGRLVAVESVNRPGDHMAARRLLANGCGLSPQEAAGEGFALKAYLKGLAATPV